jgi:hypothetical protein
MSKHLKQGDEEMRGMGKTIRIMLMVMFLVIGSLGIGAPAAAQSDNAWVLVDVVDYPSDEAWAQANKSEAYNNKVTYAKSKFSVKTIYTGASQGTKVNGEGVKLHASFTTPPKTIYKDQEVALTLTLSATENTLSYYTFYGQGSADFYSKVDTAPNYGKGTMFLDTDRNDRWTIGGTYDKSSYNTIQKTIKAKAPAGQKTGDQMALRQVFYRGVPMATYYVYEWKALGGTTPPAPSKPSAPSAFSDLSTNHWAYDDIMEMAELGILDGYADGTFKPNKTISRAEFSKILVLSLKLPKVTPPYPAFSDVPPSHWAYEVVESSKNYLTGYRNSAGLMSFAPNEVAVREDVAVAIVKAKGFSEASADLSLLNAFQDKNQISKALRNHVSIAVDKGYMKGTNKGFEPQKALTRAEASTLLSRLINRGDFQDREKVPYN